MRLVNSAIVFYAVLCNDMIIGASQPTQTFQCQYGLEELNPSGITVSSFDGSAWPQGYPSDPMTIIDGFSGYFIPNAVPDVDVDFDLLAAYIVQGSWVYTSGSTNITSVQVALRSTSTEAWKWFTMSLPVNCCLNSSIKTIIPKLSARYVKFRFTGGHSTNNANWGVRFVRLCGLWQTPV
jgi:hypothetical protein